MPRIVIVGGSSSNVGKTTLACRLLEADTSTLKIAMKVSVRETSCETRVILETEKTENGRHHDTHKLLDAGAEHVVWVTAHRSCVRSGLAKGLWLARKLRPSLLVIESTSAGIHLRRFHDSRFVAGEAAWKPWARAHLLRADHVTKTGAVFSSMGLPAAIPASRAVEFCEGLSR